MNITKQTANIPSKRTIPAGKPFTSGNDPRRWTKGSRCKSASEFTAAFNHALAEGGDPVQLAAILWAAALKGKPWAIEIILDRLIGKVTLPMTYRQQEPGPVQLIWPEYDEQGKLIDGAPATAK